MKYFPLLIVFVIITSCTDESEGCVAYNTNEEYVNDTLLLRPSEYSSDGEAIAEISRYDFLISFSMANKKILDYCGYRDYNKYDPVVDLEIYTIDSQTNEIAFANKFFTYPWSDFARVGLDEILATSKFEFSYSEQFLLFRPDSVPQSFYLKGMLILASGDTLVNQTDLITLIE